MKMTLIPVVIGALGTILKGLANGLEDLVIRGQVEIIQTTALISYSIEKNSGDLRRLAVTQTLKRNHQLTLVWKILKRVKYNFKKEPGKFDNS